MREMTRNDFFARIGIGWQYHVMSLLAVGGFKTISSAKSRRASRPTSNNDTHHIMRASSSVKAVGVVARKTMASSGRVYRKIFAVNVESKSHRRTIFATNIYRSDSRSVCIAASIFGVVSWACSCRPRAARLHMASASLCRREACAACVNYHVMLF